MNDGSVAGAQFSHLDLIASAEWKAALFTTFPLSLSFFEGAPLVKLRAGNCRQISVLADVRGYAASMSERGASGAGRSFELRPVLVREGCFHPKLVLLLGPDGPRALVGSGNLTFTGWGRNLELADYLCPQLAGSALRDLGEFLEQLPTSPKLSADLGDMSAFMDACYAAPAGGRTRLVHDLERPLVHRIVEEVEAEGGARSMRVVSPYFGSGEGVLELASRLGVDDVAVFASGQTRDGFPFGAVEATGLKVKPMSSPILDASERPLHGKAIEIETKRGGRVLITGSANVTASALVRGCNVELAVIRTLDTASHFGWMPMLASAQIVLKLPDAGQGEPVVTASFEAGVLTGRVLWRKTVEGHWTGVVIRGVKRTALAQIVHVDGSGRFRITDPVVAELVMRGVALQLELTRGDSIARGWILFADYLAAVRERGAVAEAMFKVIAGSEDATDLEAILEFVAREPGAFTWETAAHSSGAEDEAREAANKLIDPRALEPAPSGAGQQLPHLHGGSAFECLLAALRIKILTPRPIQVQETTTEGVDEEEAAAGGANTEPPRLVRARYLERFIDALEARVEQGPDEVECRRDLQLLLGFIRFCADRVEEQELRYSDAQARWLRLAARRTSGQAAFDDIDLEFSLGVCVRVLADGSAAASAHGELQRHWGGPVPDSLEKALLECVQDGAGRPWSSFSDAPAWRAAIQLTLQTPTRWQHALRLAEGARNGLIESAPKGFETHCDIDALRLAMRNGRRDRIIEIKEWTNGACPSCFMALPTAVAVSLRQTRLARCERRRCGRLLIYVGP